MTVASNKRKNMKHLHEMNDYDFCGWMWNAPPKATIELSWKLDGFFLRFGKDAEGKPFFQTARSPVLYDPMEIIWHALSKGYDNDAMTRAENYFHLIKTIWESKIMDLLDVDSSFDCEVFDKAGSLVNREKGTRTFVNVAYNDKFFSHDITLCAYNIRVASTGLLWVHGFDDNAILFQDKKIEMLGTRFKLDVDWMYWKEAIVHLTPEHFRALNSLKHADRPRKLEAKEFVAHLKEQLRVYILHEASKVNRMGENYEGVVLTVNNTEYKITTDYFKTLMAFKGVISG